MIENFNEIRYILIINLVNST